MQWIRSRSIQDRLLRSFIVLIFITLLVVISNVILVILALREGDSGGDLYIYGIAELNTASDGVATMQWAVSRYLTSGNSYYLDQFYQAQASFDSHLRSYLLYANASEHTQTVIEIQDAVNRYSEQIAPLLNNESRSSAEVKAALAELELELVAAQAKFALIRRSETGFFQAYILSMFNFSITAIIINVLATGAIMIVSRRISNVTGQIGEPILYLTNAIVAFENNVYEPEMLDRVTNRSDEIGQLGTAFERMALSIQQTTQEQERLLLAAQRFIPSQYLEFLQRSSIADIRLGDHVSAEMAILFSDVRNFTTSSEGMSPAENFEFVNSYLTYVSPIIQQQQGIIVKFLGDGMMAIFPYGVDGAVRAAIQKLCQVTEYNAERNASGKPSISIGVGIHTGHMMVGMIGEANRIQGDAFSDNVNLTSRVEGLTKFFSTSLLITEETRSRLEYPQNYHMRHLGKVQVKGRTRPITLYEVYDADIFYEQKLETCEDFETGVMLYGVGDFAGARQSFESVLKVNPNDQTATAFLERVCHRISYPAEWHGVEVMTEK